MLRCTTDLSSSRFSRFEMGILAFMLEMSLGQNFNLQSPSLERGLATHVSTLPTLQFASRTDSPTCWRAYRLSNMLPVGLSVSADNTSSNFVPKAFH